MRILNSPDMTSGTYNISDISKQSVCALTALEAHLALEQPVEGRRILARECTVDCAM